MNILSNQSLIDKGLYERAVHHFGLQAAWDKLAAGTPRLRFFRILRTDGAVVVEPLQSVQFLKTVTALASLLDPAARAHLLDITRPKSFRPHQKKALLTHLHLDLLLALAALQGRAGVSVNPDLRPGLLNHLKLESSMDNIEHRVTRVTESTSGARSNIHTFNKRSVLVDMADPAQSRHADLLFGMHVKLLRANPLIRHIEIPEDFEVKRLANFLQELLTACELIRRKYPSATKHKFSLKLRKIKHTFKEGMFFPATNTVIVDPRDTGSLWHELGHWAHTWFEPQITKTADCEAFAHDFQASMLKS